MGRNRKTGLDYFPLDVTFFQDIKVRRLMKKHGSGSIAVYASLLCMIYRDGYFIEWNEDMPFIVSEQTGLQEESVMQIIDSCLELDIFSRRMRDEHSVLTSRGIQKRYLEAAKLCKRPAVIEAYSLISSEEMGINSEEMTGNDIDTGISSEKMQQRKEKKRKEKEISLSAHTREEAACPAEKEKEIFEIFFWRNIPDPGGETARFMGYYGGRKGYNGARLLDAARSWNPQSPPPRCSPVFLTMWRVLYEKLKPDRPELAAEMLHEGCRVSVANGSVTIHAPTAVRRLIETERPPEVTEWAKGAPVRTSWP